MSYQVLARKYRPQRFEDVVGQEHVTRTLANAIKADRIAHAYLFTGPRGTGKTTLARIFAKCLNATGGPRVDFAEDDAKAAEIAEGRSLDVLEIDGASNNGVEQVRELRDTCRFAPASSKFKIYIIDEVHMLSTAAFNALLKTLEEPPSHVKFLFATTDPEKVLATILSRCQRFDLRRIPVPLIVEHLGNIAKKEGVKIEPEALHAIARGADGGMRDAESTLDQLISFCGETIVESDVLSMFGLAAQSQLLSLVNAILTADGPTAIRELNELATGGKDLGRLIADLLNHFRNLMLFQISAGKTDQIEASEAELEAITAQADTIAVEQTRRIMEVLAECEWRLRDAASKKIVVEISLLKAIDARTAQSIDAVLKQLNALRSGDVPLAAPPSPAPAKPAAAPKSSPKPSPAALKEETPADGEPEPSAGEPQPAVARKPEPKAPAPAPAGAGLESLWSQLVEAAGKASPFVKTYLLEAHPVAFEGKLFTIGFDPEFSDHIGLVDNSKNHDLLSTKLRELGHAGAKIKFIEASAPVGRKRP
ncbi:MAG TPA: DNA polymerase III subunit gamma/tau, partial [Verrucomicrobiales bacterium]|nr:DNA polymerase III subunit gamma/tau [Verrucomicrobiales bacterium]